MNKHDLPLSTAITKKVNEISIGLKYGQADIDEMVTETTSHLLKHWFLEDYTHSRTFNFHEGQRQAILNVIYAHEILRAENLESLYKSSQVDIPRHLLKELKQPKYRHPTYCLKMATGTGKTWVMQALLIWQLLNKLASPDDARFTKNFLLITPGLIIYDRLLDAFKGKTRSGIRDFETSDIKRFSALFIPENYRETVFSFVSNAVCEKHEIGKKAIGNGLIAVANWNALVMQTENQENIQTSSLNGSPAEIVKDQFPVMPGKREGNKLERLDAQFDKNSTLDFLCALPDLMNFNDEAHHIHGIKKSGELSEVQWQKSLNVIASTKNEKFIQIDLSATPYDQNGVAGHNHKISFPHIISDFDLKAAVQSCLVKNIVLDERENIDGLDSLDFRADRDEQNNVELSEGQRRMLRAGITKLKRLEREFQKLDPDKKPKMLVVCEDTQVTNKVVDFLLLEEFKEEDVLCIDSGKKAMLTEKEWQSVKEKLFNIDKHEQPKVIVSVLMLREGFDVNNICVIIPLRSTQADILLEQTVGRGLRLMWERDIVYEEKRQENRMLLDKGEKPSSLIDILSIIEHPRFRSLYRDLVSDELVGIVQNDLAVDPNGDLLRVGLVSDYKKYDFKIPIILKDAEELIEEQSIDPQKLQPFRKRITFLRKCVGESDIWISTDLESATMFGSYRVSGSVLKVGGYNEYLSRITRRIRYALANPVEKGGRKNIAKPFIGFNTVALTRAIDTYIKNYLFREAFDPLKGEGWRILLLKDVLDHIVHVVALAFAESIENICVEKAQVTYQMLSSVDSIPVSESASVKTVKSIYERLPFPKKNGGLELRFMEWCNRDSTVNAFCKLHEYKHDFLWLRYIKEDGMFGRYSPDFIVRCGNDIYLVETKAQKDIGSVNVRRKLETATMYCNRINQLPNDERNNENWCYVLAGESRVNQYIDANATVSKFLSTAKLASSEKEQEKVV